MFKMFDLLMAILDDSDNLNDRVQDVFDYINDSQEVAIYELWKMTRIDSDEEREVAELLRNLAIKFFKEIVAQLDDVPQFENNDYVA